MTQVPPRVLVIIEAIAAGHGTTPEAIVGRVRTKALDAARCEAMAIVRDTVTINYRPATYSMIGKWFGDRRHETAIHNIRVHRARAA